MRSVVFRWVVPAVAAALAVGACKVTFSDDVVYACEADADCAGDDYRCTPRADGAKWCCKPTGAEVCDGVDNDCNGVVDDSGKVEVCNGEDDDCNGLVDETFNLQVDSENCGACGQACASGEYCQHGSCHQRLELLCYDNFDNDGDGLTDCEDPDCDQQACGAACVCLNLQRAESICYDRVDNDGDGRADCEDPNCVGRPCGRRPFSTEPQGCSCAADGGMREVDCSDGLDNDEDGLADCDDPDCVGELCTPPDIYFRCTAAGACRCNGGVQVAEVGSVLCRDGIDNDCNGKKDCEEFSCDTQSCAADGGLDCVCARLQRTEANCANRVDDDGDGLVDCADVDDCPQGVSCQKDSGEPGVCTSDARCG